MSVLNNGWVIAFGFSPGPTEMLVILGVALLLYGGRLPEVARSWGKTLAEFRRGLSGIQNDLNDTIHTSKNYSPNNQIDYYPEGQAAPYSDDTVDAYRGEDDCSTDDETATIDSPEDGTAIDTEGEPIEDELTEEKPTTADTD
ncbi:MAG: twin-arginine translocase TatA/TatE family subunit [Planctomycetes bacterium]|nr:twin-arginine translocase TatA/TatE family subunit [Planctomycetota bacterium]